MKGFCGLFWNNHSEITDYKKHNPVEWEGHYDKTKAWRIIGSNAISGKVIEDNIVFVSGDITNSDCFLAIKKEYGSMNELLHISFAYPDGLDPVIIGNRIDYKDLLAIDDFKNAVIIGVRHWPNEDVRSYYIVSKKERQLYIDYKEQPNEYFIDDEQVSYDDYNYEMHKYIEVDDANLASVAGAGLKIKTFVKQDRLFKNRRIVIKAVEQSLLKENFIHIPCDTKKYQLMEHFYTPFLDQWFRKYEWDAMVEKLKKPHVPYVIKETNKPPYFMIDDYIVNADTTSWYEFILKWYFDDKVQDWMLEELKN